MASRCYECFQVRKDQLALFSQLTGLHSYQCVDAGPVGMLRLGQSRRGHDLFHTNVPDKLPQTLDSSSLSESSATATLSDDDRFPFRDMQLLQISEEGNFVKLYIPHGLSKQLGRCWRYACLNFVEQVGVSNVTVLELNATVSEHAAWQEEVKSVPIHIDDDELEPVPSSYLAEGLVVSAPEREAIRDMVARNTYVFELRVTARRPDNWADGPYIRMVCAGELQWKPDPKGRQKKAPVILYPHAPLGYLLDGETVHLLAFCTLGVGQASLRYATISRFAVEYPAEIRQLPSDPNNPISRSDVQKVVRSCMQNVLVDIEDVRSGKDAMEEEKKGNVVGQVEVRNDIVIKNRFDCTYCRACVNATAVPRVSVNLATNQGFVVYMETVGQRSAKEVMLRGLEHLEAIIRNRHSFNYSIYPHLPSLLSDKEEDWQAIFDEERFRSGQAPHVTIDRANDAIGQPRRTEGEPMDTYTLTQLVQCDEELANRAILRVRQLYAALQTLIPDTRMRPMAHESASSSSASASHV